MLSCGPIRDSSEPSRPTATMSGRTPPLPVDRDFQATMTLPCPGTSIRRPPTRRWPTSAATRNSLDPTHGAAIMERGCCSRQA
jgi:hypothetical protein